MWENAILKVSLVQYNMLNFEFLAVVFKNLNLFWIQMYTK